MTPDALRLGQAMHRSEPLAKLTELLLDSKARFTAIQMVMPSSLAGEVTPGPIDESGWSLLASNSSVAAKLRQMLPDLTDALRGAGWPEGEIRVKVRSR